MQIFLNHFLQGAPDPPLNIRGFSDTGNFVQGPHPLERLAEFYDTPSTPPILSLPPVVNDVDLIFTIFEQKTEFYLSFATD